MAKPRTSLTFHGAICSGSLLSPCHQPHRGPSNAQPLASPPTQSTSPPTKSVPSQPSWGNWNSLQDLDFVIKLASALGQVWGTAGEPNVAVRRCVRWFQSSEPNQLGSGPGLAPASSNASVTGPLGSFALAKSKARTLPMPAALTSTKPRRNSATIK